MGYLYALLPAGLVLATGLELAQAPTPGQTDLSALDTNRDGSISRVEAQMSPSLSAQFGTLDANANGALEPAEFSRFEGDLGAETTPGGRGPGGFVSPPLNSVPPPLQPSTPPDAGSPPPSGTSEPPSPR